MFKHFASVGAWTLVSRMTGFASSIVMAQVLGAGRLADAFFVAFRIPNHFRNIFAEGAFNAAYVPSYTRLKILKGPEAARNFSSQIFTLLLVTQLALLAAAWLAMPWVIRLLAPGYDGDPEKFALALTMTRITFPYLALIVLVTLHSATLNANRQFAAAAAAPVLLNITMIGFLLAAFAFPNAGLAASYGVLASGFLQLLLVMVAARRAGVLEGVAWPRFDGELKRFFTVLGPAVIGSAGVQIAIFADTILASLLPDGGQSSINYADRLYQLPIGVIGIAAGTVLLPEMSRRMAEEDAEGAHKAQNLSMGVTLALTAPFCVAFLAMPELFMRAAFMRGAFSGDDAAAAGEVLWAYGFGLMAVVLIRSAVASFQSVGNLRTPMIVSLIAMAVNVALKIGLIGLYGAPGLAMATAAGSWINLTLLAVLALRAGLMRPDAQLARIAAAAGNGALWLVVVVLWLDAPISGACDGLGRYADLAHLGLIGGLGVLVYGGLLLWQFRLMRIAPPLPGLRRR